MAGSLGGGSRASHGSIDSLPISPYYPSMIIYEPKLKTNMRDYGIMLPMSPSRLEKTLDYLKQKHSALPVYNFAEIRSKFGITEPFNRADLERVHDKDYIARLYNEGPDANALEKEMLSAYELVNSDGTYNRYEPEKATKPLSDQAKKLFLRCEGSYLACRAALALLPAGHGRSLKNFCFYFGGGSHHARYEKSSGFCILNDVILAARKILAEGYAGLVWIIDVDAHKGDGSAELIQRARDKGELFTGKAPEILSLSVHMAKGWPLDAESLAAAEPGHAPLVPSDIDIPVDSGEEAFYVDRLREGVAKLEALSGGRKPDLVIVVDGVDVYEYDGLPSTSVLKLTLEQCLSRDRFLFSYMQEHGLPSAWFNAGGYGERAWEPTAHFLEGLS
ncbi:histone deacetylase [Spirochaetia bacterium]|nr:histone deacetylase [Spirochaetia bacterium]